MKRFAPFLLAATIISVLSVASPSHAGIDPTRITNQPGATLLLPYFEAGFSSGPNTTFSFGVTGTQDPEAGGANSGPSTALTNVTIWSNLGYPVFRFNVYLTGYDMVDVNLRDVLNGHLPSTASAGQDPGDTISPVGAQSQDLSYPTCAGSLPPGPVPQSQVAHMRAALTGKQSPTNNRCYCLASSDQIARGYITIDAVGQCSSEFPTTINYFNNVLSPVNNLWGDYRVTPLGLTAPMVPLRASTTDPGTTTVGTYTFYGQQNSWTAADRRQPLATKFAAQFRRKGGKHPQTTTLVVWRDPKAPTTGNGFNCAQPPLDFPLPNDELVIFDEQETPFVSRTTPFGKATQRVVVGKSFAVVPNAGWLFIDLNHSEKLGPSADTRAAQAWVVEIQKLGTAPTMTYPVTVLDSAQSVTHTGAAG